MTYIISYLQSIVVTLHGVVQQTAFAGSNCLSSSFLNQKAKSSCLVESSKFAFVFGWSAIAEDSVSLDEDLVDINN